MTLKLLKLGIVFLTCPYFLVSDPVPSEAAEAGLLDQLERGMAYYESLKDYKAIFHKTEKSKGQMGDTEKIYLKFEKPWKIYMGWLNTGKKGLQVLYERGKHDNKLVIHKPGLLFGLAPVIFLEQTSPWVSEGSESYNIEDAGLGTFLTDFKKAVDRAAGEGKLKVISHGQVSEDGLDGEKFEVIFENTIKDEDYFAYRILVLFDQEHNLPLKQELYNWQNELTGTYAYHEFKPNVGIDEEFRRQIHRQLLKVYSHQE